MGKGILLELEGRQAVVLTPQGEFKRIPLPKGVWDIGDEISFADTKPVSWTRWGVWASAAAVMLLVSFQGFNAWALSQPVALLTIDINPSLQLTLNKRSDVLKAEALNQDGAAVLQGVDWQGSIFKRHSVDDVVAQVTAKAVEIGKLAPEDATGAVVVAVAPAKAEELPAEQSETIVAKSKVAANDTIAKKAKEKKVEVKAKVAAVVVTKQEKEEAEKAGLTPGKWAILEQAQKAAPEVKPEDIQEKLLEKGPGPALRDLNLDPVDIFGKAEEKHDGKREEKEEKKGGKSEEQPVKPASGKPGEPKPNGSGADKKDPAAQKPGNGNTNAGGAATEPGGKAEQPKGQSQDNKGKSEESKGNAGEKNNGNSEKGNNGNNGNNGNKGNAGEGNGQGGKKSGQGQQQQADKPSSQQAPPKSGGFVETIKSWFGIGEKKDQASEEPRAETPGAGASNEKGGGSEPEAEEKKSEPKAEEKKPEQPAQPKAEEKKPETKGEEKKESKEEKSGSSAEEKPSSQASEKEKGRGNGKSQEKP